MSSKKLVFGFFALLAALALFSSLAFAEADASQFLGDVSIKFPAGENPTLNPGQVLTAEVTSYNMENYPIAEGIIVIELAKGGSFYYPSNLSNADNIFFEQKISPINLFAGESRKIPVSITLPSDLSAGNYRMDVYFRTERSHAVGLTHILLGPKSASFNVSSSSGSFPELEILRTGTEFHDAESMMTIDGPEPAGIGPIGPPTKPGAEISGKVFVQNSSSALQQGVEVSASLCEWDDTSCSTILSQDSKTLDIDANSVKEFDLKLTAPTKPTAYAIRLEARKDGKLVSLYRNRAVVVGPGVRVRKLYSESLPLEAGQTAKFHALISPSADHWLTPDFNDFSLKISVSEISGKVLASKEFQIKTINYSPPSDFIEKTLEFSPEKTLNSFRLCATAAKAGKEVENYCTVYDFSKFSNILEKPAELSAKWSRSSDNSTLNLEFCTLPENKEIKANYQLLSEDLKDFEKAENFSGNNCVSKTLSVDSKKKYSLVLTDYLAGIQKTIKIGFSNEQAGNSSGGNSTVEQGTVNGGLLLLAVEGIALIIAIILLLAGLKAALRKKEGKGKR